MLTAGADAAAPAAHRDNAWHMHLMIPFAGTVSEAGRLALQTLSLPGLERLLARLSPAAVLGSDEFSLNAPHEQALALALGWPVAEAALPGVALPWAALQAEALGLDSSQPWGLLTPVQLHVGTEQVSLGLPADLQLDEATSRELLDLVRPLFESEGFSLHWAAPLQWLASHALFDGLATASLDRVTGRHLNPWLAGQREARLIHRLQSEVQMLLHYHPLNEQREAAGLPVVNSFWLSGCGRLPEAGGPPSPAPMQDDRLRAPALAEDWAGWAEAWQALDAGPITALQRAAGADTRLTLCGERRAQAFTLAPQGLWQRLSGAWRRPSALAVLESL